MRSTISSYAAEQVQVRVPNDPDLIITPLIDYIPILPAQSSVTIPITIRLRDDSPMAAQMAAASAQADTYRLATNVSEDSTAGQRLAEFAARGAQSFIVGSDQSLLRQAAGRLPGLLPA